MRKSLHRKLFLKLWSYLSTLFICVVLPLYSFADEINMDNPTLSGIGDVLIRIMNWAVYLVGIVLVLVIAYGAVKASASLGDPRGLEAAKSTWTYAVYGAIIVVGFFAIFVIVAGFFGLDIGIGGIFDAINDAIESFTVVALPEPQP